MYSFYGGQKGQDFRISHIFSNRSKDMLQDLQARWYSSINVGDYVFVSYGDIAEQDETFENENGVLETRLSKYNENLKCDLEHCGKSYANSLWQKVYIDENKTVSPSPFLDSDDAVFIFLNFKDSVLLDGDGKEILNADGNPADPDGRKTDEYGNIVNDKGEIILFRQIPGQSLRESSDIYAEENFGFGYRLIACLTGQTPKIEVYHEAIEIDDGNPYVTLDVSNLEKPKIKFYLQKAQVLNDAVKTITLSPFEKPDVDLITSGYVNIDGKVHQASLAHPILQFETPRAVQFYSGFLFGQGDLSDYPFNIATEERQSSGKQFTIDYDYVTRIRDIALALKNSFTRNAYEINNGVLSIKNGEFINNFKNIIDEYFDYLKPYYREENLLDFLENATDDVKIEDIPWGQYGLSIDNIVNYNSLKEYLNIIGAQLDNIYSQIMAYIRTPNEENLNRIPWGTHGLIKLGYFKEMLTDEERIFYCNRYLSGLSQVGSVGPSPAMIANLFNLYNPVVNFGDIVYQLLSSSDSGNVDILPPTIGPYFLEMLEQLRFIYIHFKHLVEDSLPGDMYIHTPSGRLYQISHVHNSDDDTQKYVKARYIGALTAPAPEVDVVLQNSFIKTPDGYKVNQVEVRDNILISNNELGYKEKYIFDIPETPDYQITHTVVNYQTPPTVELSIVQDENDLDDGIYDIHFQLPREPLFEARYETVTNETSPFVESNPVLGVDSDTIYLDFDLPRAVHMYTDEYHPSYITGFDKTGEGSPIISINDSNDKLSKGDVYLYTAYVKNDDGTSTYDWTDELRGYIYIYQGDGTWKRQGSILGPIGVPKTTKRIKFIRDENLTKGQVERRIDETGKIYYAFSWEDNIDEIMSNYDITDGVPNSAIGEAYIFNVYMLDNKGNEIMDESWWGQYYAPETEWSMTLITGQSNLLDDYEGNPQIAKGNTYTARYLNEILQWDTEKYY